jgi:hypothetical protein
MRRGHLRRDVEGCANAGKRASWWAIGPANCKYNAETEPEIAPTKTPRWCGVDLYACCPQQDHRRIHLSRWRCASIPPSQVVDRRLCRSRKLVRRFRPRHRGDIPRCAWNRHNDECLFVSRRCGTAHQTHLTQRLGSDITFSQRRILAAGGVFWSRVPSDRLQFDFRIGTRWHLRGPQC